MARRGKDMLSISDLQHAFSTHAPLGRDSKVVQEGSAFQSFLDSARSIGIKCSPPQETTFKSTSAAPQTTPTKAAGVMSPQSNSNIGDEKDSNGKCSNAISGNETIEEGATTLLAASPISLIATTKNLVQAAIVPNRKYNINQLLHLRKTACTNPFEHNTDEEIKLILPNGLEHQGRPPYVAKLLKRWSRNVGFTVSNIQPNVDPAVSDIQFEPLADAKPNGGSAVSNIENSGSSPLMTFSDTEESPKPTKLEENVETTKSNIQQSNVPLSKVAHNDEAALFLAWMMNRDSMNLGGK
jgi:hypothetical protein